MPQPLEWPPKKDDLERLYLVEKLSAAKMSRLYGLKHPNPKSSETLMLYHLRKFGILRRDAAAHVRKVTEEMVNEWVESYRKGESLKEIAGENVDPVTVWNHLRKRGIRLRDKVDAQIQKVTRFRRIPFRGNHSERWYIFGFVMGDCSVERHGRAIRVRTGSTHPDFVSLFFELFGRYGRVREYVKRATWVPAELNLEVDLDGTFEFLLRKLVRKVPDLLTKRHELLSFVAGFVDAEGSIVFRRKRYGSTFEVFVTNKNYNLLRKIRLRLKGLGYQARLEGRRQGRERLGYETENESEIWRLAISRHLDVKGLCERTTTSPLGEGSQGANFARVHEHKRPYNPEEGSVGLVQVTGVD